MTMPPEPIEPPVCFNMDLANAPTSERFCYEAADVLGVQSPDEGVFDDPEFVDEEVQYWTDRLHDAGYYVWWSCGDVVVWDLRTLSEEDREAFYEQMRDA
jgi:hypothetical protein